MAYDGFILSSKQTQFRNSTRLIFQGRLSDGRRFHWTVTRPRVVFFIEHNQDWTPPRAVRKPLKLKSLSGDFVDALYFDQSSDLFRARKACEDRQILTFEADVNLAARFLMEHFIQGGVRFESEPVKTQAGCRFFMDPKIHPSDYTPELKTLSIDIECSMTSDLYSIALYGEGLEEILVVDPNKQNGKKEYQSFPNERHLLKTFFFIIRQYDPDVFSAGT